MARAWWQEQMYGVHYTIREIDARGFDAPRFVAETTSLGFNLLSFDSSGYHALYPSDISLNRRGVYLEGRDIIGEIVTEARRKGLVTQVCIDVGKGPHEVFLKHPEWVCRDSSGEPLLWTTQHGNIYFTCTIGPYMTEMIGPVVEEQLRRYPLDAVLLTDFGLPRACYCPSCRRRFAEASGGQEIPTTPDRRNPVWRSYIGWRYRELARAWKQATHRCHEVRPEVKVMMNTVATFNAAIIQQGVDFDLTRDSADIVQTEAQTKLSFETLDEGVTYQSPFWPTEQIRRLTTGTDRAVVDHCSYFYAWPWRRTAMIDAYQKMWLLQVAANGGHPIIHYVGPVYAQEDRRGAAAIRDTATLLERHRQFFERTESCADVAVVFSQETLDFCGTEDFPRVYEQHMRGVLAALSGIPFDIVSARGLAEADLSRYRVLVLPDVACMDDPTVALLRKWVAGGGGLVATYETSLCDIEGNKRKDFALGDLFGCSHTGAVLKPVPHLAGRSSRRTNYYMVLDEKHPLLQDIVDTDLILCEGDSCVVSRTPGATRPLVFQPPYEIFPEGRAYGLVDRTDMAAATTHEVGSGRVVYFASQVDRLYWLLRHPDLARLLRNAVAWAGRDGLSFELLRPRTVSLTARRQREHNRIVLHLINATGAFPFEEIAPVENLVIRVHGAGGKAPAGVHAAMSNRDLEVRPGPHGAFDILLPRLETNEIISMRAKT
jgi:hypothetical protein